MSNPLKDGCLGDYVALQRGNTNKGTLLGKPGPAPYTGSDVQSAETVEKMRIAGRLARNARHPNQIRAPAVETRWPPRLPLVRRRELYEANLSRIRAALCKTQRMR